MSAPVYRICKERVRPIIFQRSFSYGRIFVQFLFMECLKIDSSYNQRCPQIDVVGGDCIVFPVFYQNSNNL